MYNNHGTCNSGWYKCEPKCAGKIWTKYEHAKKLSKNGYYQNIQTNTCKNEAGKPVFMRVPKGYRRNGRSPFRALTLFCHVFFLLFRVYSRNDRSPFRALKPRTLSLQFLEVFVEMTEARLGRWNKKTLTVDTTSVSCRNDRSPFRALKQNSSAYRSWSLW